MGNLTIYRKVSCILFLVALWIFPKVSYSQDAPLLGQTVTSSFLYNPALAGYEKGSLTLCSRQTFAQELMGLPSTNFLSYQSPFELGKLGFGGNLLFEQMGVFREFQANVSGAYHIRWKNKMSWSMGLGTDLYSATINHSKIDVLDEDDELIHDFAKNEIDYSTGFFFKYKSLGVGLSVNRLRSWISQGDILGNYVSVFAKGDFNMNERFIWQPVLIYRKDRQYNSQMDMGSLLFINKSYLAGVNYRTTGELGFSAGIRMANKIWAAYSYELFTEYRVASHEIMLRFDFRESNFPNTNSNYDLIQGKNKSRRWRKQLKQNKLKNRDSKIINQ